MSSEIESSTKSKAAGASAPAVAQPVSAAPAKSGGGRLFKILQPIFGLAILAAVAYFLPWHDQLVVETATMKSTPVRGEILGDWKSDAVEFRVDPEEFVKLGPGIPEAPLPLERAASGNWETPVAVGEAELRPSIQRVFRSVEPSGLALALLAFLGALLCGVTRWWRLLLVGGCKVRWLDSFRLTFLGVFFNTVVPGLTGGDVVKAILAVRENPGQRADALVSVLVDRLLGLFTLAALAAVMILVLGETFAELRVPVGLVLLVMALGASMYVNSGLRRAVRFDALLAKLPFADKIGKLDEAVMTFAKHRVELAFAVLLSLGNHLFAIAGVVALGRAFGVAADQIGFLEFAAIVPVANMVSSVPIAPGGWGLGEATYGILFKMVGVSAALGVAVSVGFRICQLILGLAGGLFLLMPGQRKELAEVEAPDSIL